jgi:hypothetical protein
VLRLVFCARFQERFHRILSLASRTYKGKVIMTVQNRDSHELPKEYYLLRAAAQQMESYVQALGSGTIDSTTLRQSIRHLIEYGQDSELYAVLEYAVVQAFKNVTHPLDRKHLRHSLGKASTLLQAPYLGMGIHSVNGHSLSKGELGKIIGLFEQLARTSDLTAQHVILEEIEREHQARRAQMYRNIQRVLGPA